MLTLRSIVFSSQNILLSASLLVGVFAILVSMFAITSGRWIHVFRSFPVEAEVVSARVDPFSSKLQQMEADTQRNVSEDGHHGEAEEAAEDLHFTVDCQEEKENQHAVSDVRSRHQCGTSSAGDRGRRYCADEAYGGLWRVCLLYHCLNGSAPASATATVCRQCSTATAAAGVAAAAAVGAAANVYPAIDDRRRRRPSSSLCHVTTVVIAISAEAHKTLFVYILSSALLVCGVSLGMAGTCCRSFCLILGAFFHTTAGLLQFLGMFLFASVVSDEMKSSSAADVGDSHVTQTGYNYDWGSILAVIAFAATNLAAILAAYSYRGRHQLDQKDEKASSSLIVASVDLDKAYEHS